jgi:hypothetical protein
MNGHNIQQHVHVVISDNLIEPKAQLSTGFNFRTYEKAAFSEFRI